MHDVDTLLHARWVIPIEPENTVLENHSLAVSSGLIFDILPTEQAAKQYSSKNEIDLSQHVLMPSLVNAHAHSSMSLFRGLADDLPLMTWLREHIWPLEKHYLKEDFVRDGIQLAMAEMIRSGTTCFNEHYFFPDVIAEQIDLAGLRARVGMILIEAENPWAGTVEESIEKSIKVYKQYEENPRVKFSLAPHSSYMLSDDSLLKMKKLIEKYHFPVHMHMHETIDEIKQNIAEYGVRPLKRLYDLDLLSSHFQAVHMTQVNDEDMILLKKTGAHVIHCPASNLKLASGLCPAQRLLDQGINVALGTDSAASSNNLDMFQAIYLSALLGKIDTYNPMAINAMTAIKMATINGAKALGLDNKIGSIEKGKSADVIAVDMNHFNTQPLFNPISHLAYCVNSMQVTDVWVAGKPLLKDKKLTMLDEKEILDRSKYWRKKFNTMKG